MQGYNRFRHRLSSVHAPNVPGNLRRLLLRNTLRAQREPDQCTNDDLRPAYVQLVVQLFTNQGSSSAIDTTSVSQIRGGPFSTTGLPRRQ
jgi:hypothetical protein